MTDNEIIKALECCKKGDCKNCTFDECTTGLLDKGIALDFINRQKAEIEKHKCECVQCCEKTQNCIVSLQKTFAEQKAEIERLEAEIDKQYEIAEANVRAEIASGGTSCHWCEDKVRAEAIKEFAELVKSTDLHEYVEYNEKAILGYECLPYSFNEDIDNLVKEMVGDGQ